MLRELIHEFPTDAYGEIQFGQAEGINNRAKVSYHEDMCV